MGRLLKNEGYQVDVAADHAEAIRYLQAAHYDLAFVDIMLAGESGINVMHDIKTLSHSTQVVIFTGCPEVETAAEAVRLGAFDYLTKPVHPKTLLAVSLLALNQKKMNDESERYRANLDAIFGSVSDSIIMVDAEGRLAQFNPTAGSVCGYTPDLLGKPVSAIDLGCKGVCRATLLETLHTNSSKDLHRFECGNGRIVSIKSTPISEAGGAISGAVAVIRDETPMVELEHSLKRRGQTHNIIGISSSMQGIYSLIEALTDVPTTVLIHGESGTGKELVAAALHYGGRRADKPFVKVNCSALSESLLESELFGHVRGAFTGAIADKVGRFQKAHRGTLFLDEISDISPAIQMRLLRVLQESEFERVGESTSIKVDVRVIAATNRNLAEMVQRGTFRQDLYYRLNVVRMELPPLRERGDDIDLLADHFMKKFNLKFGKNVRAFSDDVIKCFRAYPWPGNVRELEHAVEHATLLCSADIISLHNLPQDLVACVHGEATSRCQSALAFPFLNKKLTLKEALEMSGGNKTRAARLLGVSRLTVYRQLEKHPAK